MGWESTNVTGNWNGSGTGPVARSHHRANRTRSGTVPLRSHREVVGSFRNDWTQWNRCEHGRPVSGTVPVPNVWCEHGLSAVRAKRVRLPQRGRMGLKKVATRLRMATLNVGSMTGKGSELADVLNRRRINITCVEETRWKGSKAK